MELGCAELLVPLRDVGVCVRGTQAPVDRLRQTYTLADQPSVG